MTKKTSANKIWKVIGTADTKTGAENIAIGFRRVRGRGTAKVVKTANGYAALGKRK